MRKAFLFILFILLCIDQNVFSQNDSLVLKRSIALNGTYFTTDPIGNIYLVSNHTFIYKLNPRGDSLAVFNDIKKGNISQIDASNPLRILVFYANHGWINILDNMMSLKRSLDLKKINLFNIPCIANSADAQIWVYDPTGNLIKIDEQLVIKYNSPLRNMVDQAINPMAMRENNRELFMSDTSLGILKFDRFGFYNTQYKVPAYDLNMKEQYIFYKKADSFYSYNLQLFQEKAIQIPAADDVKQIRLERNQIYILRENTFDIYSLGQ